MVQGVAMKFNDVIPRLVQLPEAHARFVNTLSMLEYVGARKILKSQRAESISSQVLAHAAEEIRHAQILKRVAMKMSDGKLDSYSERHLLCGLEANRYIQTIDRSVEVELDQKDSWVNYLYTTLIIEERANQIYPIYEEFLAESGFAGILKAIVREEDNHLQDISKDLKTAGNLTEQKLERLRYIEEDAFGRFMSQVSAEISRA
jgi:hypothetical protein